MSSNLEDSSKSLYAVAKDMRSLSSKSVVPLVKSKSSKIFDMTDSKYANMIDQKSHEPSSEFQFLELIRLKVKKYIATSWLGKAYTNVLLLLSVLSCALYITQTYFNHSNPLHIVSRYLVHSFWEIT
jgi:hypothetical protein